MSVAVVKNINAVIDNKLCSAGAAVTERYRIGYLGSPQAMKSLLRYRRAQAIMQGLRDNRYYDQTLGLAKTLINGL